MARFLTELQKRNMREYNRMHVLPKHRVRKLEEVAKKADRVLLVAHRNKWPEQGVDEATVALLDLERALGALPARGFYGAG